MNDRLDCVWIVIWHGGRYIYVWIVGLDDEIKSDMLKFVDDVKLIGTWEGGLGGRCWSAKNGFDKIR